MGAEVSLVECLNIFKRTLDNLKQAKLKNVVTGLQLESNGVHLLLFGEDLVQQPTQP